MSRTYKYRISERSKMWMFASSSKSSKYLPGRSCTCIDVAYATVARVSGYKTYTFKFQVSLRSVTYEDWKCYTARKIKGSLCRNDKSRVKDSGALGKKLNRYEFMYLVERVFFFLPKLVILRVTFDEFYQYPSLTIIQLFRSVYLGAMRAWDVLWKGIGITSLERTLPILVARRSEVNRYNFRRLCVRRLDTSRAKYPNFIPQFPSMKLKLSPAPTIHSHGKRILFFILRAQSLCINRIFYLIESGTQRTRSPIKYFQKKKKKKNKFFGNDIISKTKQL